MTEYINDKAMAPNEKEHEVEEVELSLEDMEGMITPIGNVPYNHNETIVSDDIVLSIEELEEVIAPYISLNHNETIVVGEIELSTEELEDVIAPIVSFNHNETIVSDEVELRVEELEEFIAPIGQVPMNHNET